MSSSDVDHRNIAISMRKSVENLVISSQDAIGQSISQALSFSGVISQHSATPAHQLEQHRNVSRSPSPCRRTLEAAIPESPDDDKMDAMSICSAVDAGAGVTLRGSAGGGRAKKKSWYSALYPTYKSRSDDFKRLFKDLPEEERLIVDYSCALQKDILAHGRLYVSQNYLCFYANIFGWETAMTLRWKDVTSITKEKTALVIPNAILVCTDTEKNFLASFSGRDKAYLMLFRVWQNALMNQQMGSHEIWQWVRTCYGEELGFNSDDEEYGRELCDDDKLPVGVPEEFLYSEGACEDSLSRCSLPAGGAEHPPCLARSLSQPPLASAAVELAQSQAHVSGGRQDVETAGRCTGGAVESARGVDAGDALPTDVSDSSDSDRDKSNGGCGAVRCADSHAGRSLLQLDVPVNIDALFTMLFTNSKFCLELLASRGTSDYIQSVWKHNPETGLKCRQVSYTLALTQPIGPKSVHVTETQVMNKCSKPGQVYSVDISSVNAGVPYADSFYVVTHYCLQRRGDGVTSLALYCNINYKKNVWGIVKGFIEKNTWTGIEDYCRLLEAALLRETDSDRAQVKRKGKRRRRAVSSVDTSAAVVLKGCSDGGGGRLGAGAGAAVLAGGRDGPAASRWLLAVLALLLVLNALLYWRLYCAPRPHVELLREQASSWMTAERAAELRRVLESASHTRRDQMHAWRDALQRAIYTLRQAEDALENLVETIRPVLEHEPEPGPTLPPPPHTDL